MVYAFIFATIALALAFVTFNFARIKSMREGDDDMKELASIIRNGAKTFMRTEYKIIIPVVLGVAVIFTVFIEVTSGISFIVGACMSSLACIIGMRGATYANVRTTYCALKTKSPGKTTKVALCGGSISGFSVAAFGLLGFVALYSITGGIKLGAASYGLLRIFQCNPTIMRLTTYSLGCSLVAMFNRVAGGNYTKAADISADIVAKIRHDLPEDDSRMPNTIADFIGDCVNDIAGNCSDLLESYVATIVAAILIAASLASQSTADALLEATTFPIILAGIGLLSCIIGVGYTTFHKANNDPARELNMATYISAGLTLIGALIGAKAIFGSGEFFETFKLGWISPWLAAVLGIASGVLIGKITEYYTGTKFKSVKQLVQMAKEGIAFLVTKGDAVGSRSCLLPILIIGLSILISGAICGTYGIAIAALGMLSFVATTVSIDAFGPIADNAGGIAESCHLDESVREITDNLDAYGNTTAAIGKGFAIGSAAFATVSLIIAYVQNYATGTPVLNFANFTVVVGGLIGGALVEYFSALLTDHTIESAQLMAEEGDRQLTPAVLSGEEKPNYERCIRLAAEQALRKMLLPSVLALLIPDRKSVV